MSFSIEEINLPALLGEPPGASPGLCVCFLGWNPPGLLSCFLTTSFPAAKMPLPRTVTPGPELQSPKEPRKSQTLPRDSQKSNSMKESRVSHGDTLRPSLSTLKRTLFRASLPPPSATHKPKEDPGLIRRSSRFLLRSLRRALDEGLAAGHPQVTAVPEKPSRDPDGVSRQASTGMGPEDLEPQAGRVSHNVVRGN